MGIRILGWKPGKQEDIHGKQFIECFLCYPLQILVRLRRSGKRKKFEKYDAKTMFRRPVCEGYDDMAILAADLSTDFYKNGFNHDRAQFGNEKSHPDRFILNGAFDPRDGTKGLEDLHALV